MRSEAPKKNRKESILRFFCFDFDPFNALKASDWITLLGVIIAFIGVIVTIYFSSVVAKISKESAETAKRALLASEQAAKRQEEEMKTIKQAHHYKSIKSMKQVWAGLHRYTESLPFNFRDEDDFSKGLRILPMSHGFNDDTLAMHFTEEQRQIIESFWYEYHSYLLRSWFTKTAHLMRIIQKKRKSQYIKAQLLFTPP